LNEFHSHRSLRSKRCEGGFRIPPFSPFHISRGLNAKYSAHPTFVLEVRLLSPLANFLMGPEEKNGGSTAKYRLLANLAIYTG